ncbi:DUF4114 domain-containing protein [Nostoc commune]|uniref:DUF4114 domain-containing protein n=1 Tax=Nostoc commune TaxID=1178 RepID=UPI0018C53317|nr:DUF4114 domain-containing protein [Nostoc commune]MBG1264793.1 DUF4114 domain-containing protein [Nostoc commune BAE]
MKATLLTALIAATATLTGLVAKVETASAAAFTWNNAWTQPTISSKSKTGFNDTPFQQFVQKESVAIANSGQFKLDPSKLNLKYDYDVSVFFINEGASYRNQLAFNATTATTSNSGLLFKDASCGGVGCMMSGGDAVLQLGDQAKVGNIAAGTQLDFFLKSGASKILGTQTALNGDGLNHVISYAYNNYIILGFEDVYGTASDRDFNDLVVVLDIGEANVKALIGATVPEPSVTLSMFAVGAVSMFGLRRRQTRNSN